MFDLPEDESPSTWRRPRGSTVYHLRFARVSRNRKSYWSHRRGAREPPASSPSDRVRRGVLLRRPRVAAGRRVRVSDGLPAGRTLGRRRAGRIWAARRPARPPYLAAAGSERVRGPRGPVRGLARARDDGDDAGRAYAPLNYHLDPPPSPSVSEARFGFNRSYSTISLLASVLQAAKATAYPSV